MELVKKHFFNILLVVLVAFVAIRKGPGIFNNFKAQNSKPKPVNVERISGELISFPVIGQKKLVIFWMIDCQPCKLEMKRVDEMVGLGILRGDQVIAVNFVDTKEQIQQYLKEQPFQFLIAIDQDAKIADQFNVNSTPSIFLFDENGYVNWATSGVSPSLSFRIQNFFKKL